MPESFAERESRERAEARSQRLAARRVKRRALAAVEAAAVAAVAEEPVLVEEEEVEVTHATPAPRTVTRSAGYDLAICEYCDDMVIRFDGDEWDHVDSAESECG
jgi:hypothetical protein